MTESCLLEYDALIAGGEAVSLARTDEGGVGSCEPLAPGVFFLRGATRYFEDGVEEGPAGSISSLMCNNGWVDLGEGVLLIDANMPGRTEKLLAAVRATIDKPIRYLVNTHHHGDHIYGNRTIRDQTGVAIIACAEMVDELHRYETGAFGGQSGRWEQVAKLRPDVAATPILPPTLTFDRRLVIEGSARRVELLHLTWGHTRGDTAVWLPDEAVLFVGDLATNGPFNIVRDGEMRHWPQYLAALESLKPAVVCPGHGDRAGSELLTRQRTFLEALWAQVERRASGGAPLSKIVAEIEDIRAALSADPAAAALVIPVGSDLTVMSLTSQVERVFSQLDVYP